MKDSFFFFFFLDSSCIWISRDLNKGSLLPFTLPDKDNYCRGDYILTLSEQTVPDIPHKYFEFKSRFQNPGFKEIDWQMQPLQCILVVKL